MCLQFRKFHRININYWFPLNKNQITENNHSKFLDFPCQIYILSLVFSNFKFLFWVLSSLLNSRPINPAVCFIVPLECPSDVSNCMSKPEFLISYLASWPQLHYPHSSLSEEGNSTLTTVQTSTLASPAPALQSASPAGLSWHSASQLPRGVYALPIQKRGAVAG